MTCTGKWIDPPTTRPQLSDCSRSHLYRLPRLHTYGGGRFFYDDQNRDDRRRLVEMDPEKLSIQRLAITDYDWWAPDSLASRSLGHMALSPVLIKLDLRGIVGVSVYDQLCSTPGFTRFPSLRFLRIPEPTDGELQLFYRFLRLCPDLFHLCVGLPDQRVDPRTTFSHSKPAGLLPKLESFEGSLPHATLLVPGSPVHELVIIFSTGRANARPREKEAFAPLASSTAQIRSMRVHSIPWSQEHAAFFGKIFPNLQDLRLTFGEKMMLVSCRTLQILVVFFLTAFALRRRFYKLQLERYRVVRTSSTSL